MVAGSQKNMYKWKIKYIINDVIFSIYDGHRLDCHHENVCDYYCCGCCYDDDDSYHDLYPCAKRNDVYHGCGHDVCPYVRILKGCCAKNKN